MSIDSRPSPLSFPSSTPQRYEPSKPEIEQLIAQAERHPLGLDFLANGALESVSAVFQTHAFVVDSAREYLRRT